MPCPAAGPAGDTKPSTWWHSGIEAVDARIQVEAAPVLVAEQLSASSARRVRQRLERAGATAAIAAADDGPPDPGDTAART